jgi:hypothetical protein
MHRQFTSYLTIRNFAWCWFLPVNWQCRLDWLTWYLPQHVRSCLILCQHSRMLIQHLHLNYPLILLWIWSYEFTVASHSSIVWLFHPILSPTISVSSTTRKISPEAASRAHHPFWLDLFPHWSWSDVLSIYHLPFPPSSACDENSIPLLKDMIWCSFACEVLGMLRMLCNSSE